MSDRIRPSDLPYAGSRPSGVGFCKDNNGNLLWDGGDSISPIGGGAGVSLNSGVDNAGNNTAKINAQLLSSGAVNITEAGTYYVNAGIVIGDYQTLYIGKGVTLKLAPGQRNNIITTQGYLNPDYTVTSLTSSGTVCTATVSNADFDALNVAVGAFVAVNWALPQFYSGVFEVTAVDNSANTITYKTFKLPSATTATAGSGGAIKIRKATIRPSLIVDGAIDYDSTNQAGAGSTLNLHAVIMSHAYKPVISGKFANALKYCTLLACSSFADVPEFFASGPSDGLHLTGPLWFPKIGTVTGDNADNLFAAGSGDYAAYLISEGAIVGAIVDRIVADNPAIDPCRVWGTSAYSADVTIGELAGYTTATVAAARLIADASVLPDGNSWVANFEIKKLSITGSCPKLVFAGAKRMDKLSFTPQYNLASNSAQACISITDGVTGLGLIEINGGQWQGASSSKLVDYDSGLAADPTVVLNGVKGAGSWIVNNNSTRSSTTITNGCDFSAATNTVRAAAASGTNKLQSAGSKHPATALVKTSTALLESYGFDVTMPATTNLTTTNGQSANIAGALNITKGAVWAAL